MAELASVDHRCFVWTQYRTQTRGGPLFAWKLASKERRFLASRFASLLFGPLHIHINTSPTWHREENALLLVGSSLNGHDYNIVQSHSKDISSSRCPALRGRARPSGRINPLESYWILLWSLIHCLWLTIPLLMHFGIEEWICLHSVYQSVCSSCLHRCPYTCNIRKRRVEKRDLESLVSAEFYERLNQTHTPSLCAVLR